MKTAHRTPRVKPIWEERALALFFRLNGALIDCDPFSHQARRAARLIPQLVAAMDARS